MSNRDKTRLLSSQVSVFSLLATSLFLVFLTACDSLPSGGPRATSYNKNANATYGNTSRIPGDEKANDLPFALVDVDRNVMNVLLTAEDDNYFVGAFTDRTPPSTVPLGVGDILRITIFESGPGGLFVPQSGAVSSGNFITLPDQEVDQSGSISVPYAGKEGESGLIKVDGKTAAEVQHDIQKRLMNKAIEPQVIVTLVKRTSNMFSVIGDVNAPGRFSLEHGGMRILDAISTAGGPKDSDYKTLVTLQRGTNSATARMSEIFKQSDNNIFVQPGDVLAIKKDERYYNVLGAMNNNSRIPFEAEHVTLADALAKAGGLNAENAEPSAVVIFRREHAKTLETIGISTEGFNTEEPIPTVYRFDLSNPTGLFLAQKMQLRGDDAIFVSKHGFSDMKQLLNALYDALLLTFISRR